MSKEEIRGEIDKILNEFSEKELKDLLTQLQGAGNEPTITLLYGNNFARVLAEDSELLQKLAQ